MVLLTNPAATRPRPGVLILPAAQTDCEGILAAMQKYLVDVPQRGDTVVFYDASHGSLRANSNGSKLEQYHASCTQFWQVLNHAVAFSDEICGNAFLIAW